MKIITWNCNGAFRKKFHALLQFNADIIVIQECENPAESKDLEYNNWAKNYLWIGDSKNKGLAIFAKEKKSTAFRLD
jgi:exonuclease III